MRAGELTPHEEQIIRQLLAKKRITHYEVVGAVGEGKALPGSNSPGDLEALSGIIVTPTKAYSFWLDWIDGHYSLGEEDGTWGELSPEEMKDYEVVEAQERLRREGTLNT